MVGRTGNASPAVATPLFLMQTPADIAGEQYARQNSCDLLLFN